MNLLNPLRKRQLEKYKTDLHDEAVDRFRAGVSKSKSAAENAAESLMYLHIPRYILIRILISVIIFALFMLSVYIPKWILPEREGYYALAHDSNAYHADTNNYQGEYADDDFDNDGLKNKDEYAQRTDMFDPDSDGDGVSDGEEINTFNRDPLKYGNELEKIVKKQDKKEGKTIKDPYTDEGLILWADSYKDKAHGVVIKDFNGWVQFPNSRNKFVYALNNNKAEKLKYRETENAYYIDEDSFIILLDNKISYKYTLTFAGKSMTFKNGFFGNILSFLLPAEGRTYLKCAKEPDFKMTEGNTSALIKISKYTNTQEDRLSDCTNSLTDLAKVWNTIYEHKCVYVSFYDEEVGESIGIAYAGKLTITYNAGKIYNNGSISKNTWFEFKGLGYNSQKGARINFFGTENDKEHIDYFS